jgi:excisionase family DNA binding protein
MHGDERILAVGIAEAARRLAVSARTVAALIARGELASRKVGRRRIISVDALESFLNDAPTGRDHRTRRIGKTSGRTKGGS